MRTLTAVLLVLALAAATTAADPPPATVRAVVVDTSGSMAGERLDAVKEDLAALTKDLPPSADHPVIVIPFNSEVKEVRTFTDRESFLKFASALKADGGTSIASGLAAAIKELGAHAGSRHFYLLLYSDGEDSDAAGIRTQEEKLDALFSGRRKQGLGQTVVFAKRWEGANKQLRDDILKRGNAPVIDAGELKLIPVTLRPSVSCVASRWVPGVRDVVEVDLTAKLEAVGLPNDGKIASPSITIRSPGVSGKPGVTANATVPVGGTQKIQLRVPVTADMVRAKTTDLEFEVGQPGEASIPKGKLFPTVAGDHGKVAVPLPAWDACLRLTAVPSPDAAAKWVQPLVGRAAIPLRITVHPDAPGPWPGSLSLRVALDEPFQLVGDGRLTLTSNEPVTVTLAAEGALRPNAGNSRIGVSATFVDPPLWLSADRKAALATADVPPLAPVRTKLTVRPVEGDQVQARWTDLERGIGIFEVSLRVTVGGPIPSDSAIAARVPDKVKSVAFQPALLTEGEQVVRAVVETELEADRVEPFTLNLIPPSASGAVVVDGPPPVKFQVTAPAAGQLVLATASATPAVIELNAPAEAGEVTVVVTPTLVRPDDSPGVVPNLPARVSASGGLAWEGLDQSLPTGVPTKLTCRLPTDTRNFFTDTVYEAELETTPAVPTVGVAGSRQTVRVHVEAPFKRWLMILAAIAVIALAVYVLWTRGRRLISNRLS